MRSTSKPWVRRVLLAFLVPAALLVPASCAAAATTYHVDPAGSDANPGSEAAPFRTISRAAQVVRSGDTVLVDSGRYAETVTLNNRNGVTFRGVGDTRPVIDGEGTRDYGFFNLDGDDVVIEGFEITGQTQAGVYTRGVGDTVTDNVIHDVGSPTEVHSNGVRVVWGSDDRVTANTIHNIGPGGESMGIWLVQTKNAVVDGNDVYFVRKEGVRDWQGLDNAITNNRVYLNWVGIAFNTSTGTTAVNNYLYDNVEGFDLKHTSYTSVLAYWKLATAHWSKVWHNTVYASSETSVWIAQSDEPADYLDIRDNIFDGAAGAFVRDAPKLRGPHVIVDGNAYVYPPATKGWLYKAGWNSDPGLSDWATYRTQLGWEANGLLLDDAQLRDPDAGDLDYPDTSPAAAGSLHLGDALDNQLGARGLAPAPVRWTAYAMTPIDSSSKGTWWTTHRLGATVDANQLTYWLSDTPSNEYVTYDFGQQRTFDHLVVTIFQHWDNRNPHGYRFEVSDDNVNWHTVLEGQNPDDEGSAYNYTLSTPATARYLRYTMLDTFCTSFAPRTDCGAYFVFSDLTAGLLSPTTDGWQPPSAVTGSATQPASTAGLPTATTTAPRPAAPKPSAPKTAGRKPAAAPRPAGGATPPRTLVTSLPLSAPVLTIASAPGVLGDGKRVRLVLRCAGPPETTCAGVVAVSLQRHAPERPVRRSATRVLRRATYRVGGGSARAVVVAIRGSALRAVCSRRPNAHRMLVTIMTSDGARTRLRARLPAGRSHGSACRRPTRHRP